MLYGRIEEQAAIDRLLTQAKAGSSGVLVLRGQPGIGKTALLDYAAGTDGLRILRSVGVESEAELPYAGLHLLLGPWLNRIGSIPEPQRRALEGAFGLAAGSAADRLLVGLAVLSLLAELAEDSPVLCIIDDAQWLDRASADALLLAARRLHAEGIALIFAARDSSDALPAPGLPELHLTGLHPAEAAGLLDSHSGKLTPAVRYRVLAEAGGNPLALLELPAALTAGSVGAAYPGSLPLPTRLQLAFYGQIVKLPAKTRTLLLVAAEDAGDLDVVLRAGESLGAVLDDLTPAEQAGLIRLTNSVVSFRHPLVRAAVSNGAPSSNRLAVHRALAAALADPNQADRRAWHLAAATTGPEEQVAAELERTAIRAGERSGYAAAAAAYERAGRLSVAPDAKARRLTLAAEAACEIGDFDRARSLARSVRRETEDHTLRARLLGLCAKADFGQGALKDAHALLCTAVDLVEATDPHGALWILTEMVFLAWHLGDDAVIAETGDRLEGLALPAADPLLPLRQLLIWLTQVPLGRTVTTLPPMSEVIAGARRIGVEDPRNLLLTSGAGMAAGADAETNELAQTAVALVRNQGRIGLLPAALTYLATAQLYLGRYRDSLANATEAAQIAIDTAQPEWQSQANAVLANLAAIQGDEERCRCAAMSAFDDRSSVGAAGGQWGLALLDLGAGRAEVALSRLEHLAAGTIRYQLPIIRSIPDLIEAAVRIGEPDRAAGPLARFAGWAEDAGQPWIDALVQRCRALLASGTAAERHYRAALEIHEQHRPMELARTQLLYGEWLRRARRATESRTQLRSALETFDRLGAAPWADRARCELDAAGAAVPNRRQPGAFAGLTPQELQIVRLAGTGLSNRDIAAQLFLSPRTVGHHLYKAYPKLGVTSRGELAALSLTD